MSPTPLERNVNDVGEELALKKQNDPSAADLLVQLTRETERLRALLLADQCETIEDFRAQFANMVDLIHV